MGASRTQRPARGPGREQGSMTAQVALLRAVNVGGTGALPMARLRAIGEDAGLTRVRTYIASGNLLCESDLAGPDLAELIEAGLEAVTGRRIEVFTRTLAELDAIIGSNPFPGAQGSRHMVFFFAEAPLPDLPQRCRDRKDERIALVGRELHVDYGDGIGTSKLKIPGKLERTARNFNTVRAIAGLLRA